MTNNADIKHRAQNSHFGTFLTNSPENITVLARILTNKHLKFYLLAKIIP